MDNEENLKDYLKAKYPGAFEGWDEFEFSAKTRVREGKCIMLVTLFNAGKDGYVVDVHANFLLSLDDDGEEVIRVGGGELGIEYNEAYVPEFAK